MSMYVSEIWCYPIKSCAGMSLQHAALDPFGLAGDRRWMVVDQDGRMVTQRECPRMTLIKVAQQLAGLQISAPTMTPLSLLAPRCQRMITVQVWQDVLQACLAESAAQDWLSRFLQRDVRLVWCPPSAERQVDLAYAKPGQRVAFADGFPLLLISQASLDDLNARLDSPIEMARFRPNLVISGCAAFEEDRHRAIKIGEAVFPIVKPCARCPIPSIDLIQATRSREPTRCLRGYRKRDGEVFFGQNLLAPVRGVLQLGMRANWC
jgi:hypothetical protein